MWGRKKQSHQKKTKNIKIRHPPGWLGLGPIIVLSFLMGVLLVGCLSFLVSNPTFFHDHVGSTLKGKIGFDKQALRIAARRERLSRRDAMKRGKVKHGG